MNRIIDGLPHIDGYEFREQIYQGAKTQVYRAVRSRDQTAVIIKLLQKEYPSFNELLQFRNQYAITKNLDIPGIVHPYSLENYGNSYALVMEDYGGISLRDYTRNQPLELKTFLAITVQIVDSLQELYKHRIIHKDIKPDNILIHPQTQQVKLIDFSIASLLPRETQEIKSPNFLEGTLNYISPEQTGRMNRGIDYRSDFYALGVTFYELLSGQLPFLADEPMELVHCHIAKTPTALKTSPNIPPVLSDIVMKLLAKNAEDRYQSALGIKYDLEKCLLQLEQTGAIQDFVIAQRDLCDRFIISDKLYGRTTDIETLLQAFERVSLGATEMMLVAGFSGIGKTAIVNEVHKPIVRQRGYFIKGKYDQFNRNIPFNAFVQAFRDLMGQLLTESYAQIQKWQTKILAVLGENAQVIIDVIPELSRIIGQQPPVLELSGHAAQNRFNLLFQKFTQVFTTAEHPLVIFLDDLQWADSASLKLMQLLMADTGYLFLIGAYRDHEVNPAHPLMLTLSEISQTSANIHTINLASLSQNQVNKFVADTLKCPEDTALSLSKLIYQKTQGNPFFSKQFLQALHEDEFITFNWELGSWQCDITRINQQALTDDVLQFMVIQLEKLSLPTQKVLKLAACIGNEFDLNTLAIVCEQSQEDTAADLWTALQSGLILPISNVYKFYQRDDEHRLIAADENLNQQLAQYKFLHDRVQQAAYSLIPADQKQATHIKIGRLLRDNTPQAQLEEQIFAIANQLNTGLENLLDPTERYELSRLNLIAGKKAKTSTAYSSALTYLKIGIQLLPAKPWQFDYNFTLSLYVEAAEASYLSGEWDAMEDFSQEILQQATNVIDTAKVYEVKIEAYGVQGKLLAAIDTAMQFLQPIGIEFPPAPTDEDFFLALQEVQTILSGKNIADLADLPEMQDPELRAALRVLVKVGTPAYLAKPELYPLIVLKEIVLSITYGNTSASAFSYSAYGLILCCQPDSVSTGYEFGQLALQLLSKFPDREYEARVLVIVHHFIIHWKQPVITTLKPLLQAYTSGLDRGDLEYAGYAAFIYCLQAYIAGQELTQLAHELAVYGQALEKINQKTALNYNNLYHQVILNLIEPNPRPWELVSAVYDENSMLALHEQTNDGTGLWHLFHSKLILAYLFQAWNLVGEYAIKAKQYSASGNAMVNIALLNFYDSLVQLALFSTSSPSQQQQILQQVAENQAIMQKWANHAPMNQLHRFYLVEAERYQILGKNYEAGDCYDSAIAKAKENGYLQETALANELAAKFYLNWGKEKVAAGYMQEAYYCYAKWGAKAKTDDLEQRYPRLLKPILEQRYINLKSWETISTITFDKTSVHGSTTNNANISEVLDFTSVLKAAQTISSSIKLDELLTNLTQIILENSGAKKCILILPQDDNWQIRAITSINSHANSLEQVQTILESESLDTCQYIPNKIINYVKNTQEIIVINNCQTDIPGLIGQYMLEHQPKSVLCTPIINQGHLLSILYLENQLTSGVFTNDRLQVINLLSSQAAISLENARLYQQAQQALKDLQQAQLQIVQSEKMSALGNLVAGIAHEMNNPLGFIAASLHQAKPILADIIEHLHLYQESQAAPSDKIIKHAKKIDLDYSLEDFPKMIDAMNIACDRLQNISNSLRTFSRADKDYKVKFNIHDGIDSTILILKHRLKANAKRPAIEVMTNYGDLPQIKCFPGQLNQVFMNILANAIDALDEANEGRSFAEIQDNPNQIIITTAMENNQVKITIADNGKGMSESVKQKVFDHLFTTKIVGQGTGLGLAIAKQIIVEKHAGTIEVNSTPGQGTEFILTLPIQDISSAIHP